jgi:integrase/recombinase XerD
MAVTTTWPIRGTHGFKGVGLGHLGIDLSVWKYRVHGAAMRSTRFCIYRRGRTRAERLRVHFARMRGARVSELISMTVGDVVLDRSSSIRIQGKGRKERTVPLWRTTANQIRLWLRQNQGARDRPLFPNRTGGPMTRTGVTDRLKLAAATAATRCPQLKKRHISPHIVRHATAMNMLQSGVDITVIALWLGHESTATTHMYVEADLAMKERALKTLQAPSVKTRRFWPEDRLLAFLEGL